MTDRARLLEVKGVSVEYRSGVASERILQNVTLTCEVHEIVVIIGKSGCGKTSLLKCVAGLIRPAGGAILLDGRIVRGPSRERGLVQQQYCVFPWLTVRGNIELGARCSLESDGPVVRAEVARLLKATGLAVDQHKWAGQLSGGMQQRVAIARTLAADPELLLLDEPFAALDAVTRLEMQQLIREMFDVIKQGVLLVTHDIREAVLLGDRIVLLGGKPATVRRVWEVREARKGSNSFGLTNEQEKLVSEILTQLRGQGDV